MPESRVRERPMLRELRREACSLGGRQWKQAWKEALEVGRSSDELRLSVWSFLTMGWGHDRSHRPPERRPPRPLPPDLPLPFGESENVRGRVATWPTSLERCGCGLRNGVVLLSRSTADTDRTDDLPVLLQRNATSKNHDLAVVGSVDSKELIAGL